MSTLVCLLEERSAEVMLRGILPHLIPEDCEAVFIPFEGKQDLEKQLVPLIRSGGRILLYPERENTSMPRYGRQRKL